MDGYIDISICSSVNGFYNQFDHCVPLQLWENYLYDILNIKKILELLLQHCSIFIFIYFRTYSYTEYKEFKIFYEATIFYNLGFKLYYSMPSLMRIGCLKFSTSCKAF